MLFIVKKNVKRCMAFASSLLTGKAKSGPGGGRILMYHSIGGTPKDHWLAIRVPEDAFERQLAELKQSGYKTFPVSELIEDSARVEREKGIIITFDDGYKDNATAAAEGLKKLGFRATFFVTTSYIDGTVTKKWAGGSTRSYMSWEDVRTLSRMGFEIGSHMVHHAALAELKDAEMRLELQRSKEEISAKIGKPVTVCSYPYGSVDAKVMAAAKEAGYAGACSSLAGSNTTSTSRPVSSFE